jgi:hypothetical protein
MNGENQKTSRFHAQIRTNILGHEATINIFAETLNEIYRDIANVVQQYPGNLGPARREVANAELKANQRQPQHPNPEPTPQPAPPEQGPICQECGTGDFMELIRFKDKKGNPRQAWKCQQCQKWHWEDNGKGR